MGKTRDHLKKIRHTKGTFHAKMKDRNGMDLTEVEDIQKRTLQRDTSVPPHITMPVCVGLVTCVVLFVRENLIRN